MKAKSASGPLNSKRDSSEPSAHRALTDGERRDWLRLIRTPHVGPVLFWNLLSHFGSAATALDALPDFAGSRIPVGSIPSRKEADAELSRAEASGLRLHAAGEAGYPPLLAKIEVPPPLLYVKGSDTFWRRPPIAVVGSRNASAAGLKFAAGISAALARDGFGIVSGLARGIDAAAHRAALPFGTAAVLPGGLDAIYPPEHHTLASEIAGNGLLVSECPPGFIARSQDFPRRNRIISGCCLGVIVVEAAERSGSLITARLAAEQSREVFAVPGHPFEARAAGTNRLIKEGATFTTSPGDVIEALGGALRYWAEIGAYENRSGALPTSAGASPVAPADSSVPACEGSTDFLKETTEEIVKLLSLSPIDIDELCRLTNLETRHINAALLALELSGRIERQGPRLVTAKP
jgi:DNA processing protein